MLGLLIVSVIALVIGAVKSVADAVLNEKGTALRTLALSKFPPDSVDTDGHFVIILP